MHAHGTLYIYLHLNSKQFRTSMMVTTPDTTSRDHRQMSDTPVQNSGFEKIGKMCALNFAGVLQHHFYYSYYSN